MKKYNLSDRETFKEVKEACLWLMENTNYKFSVMRYFFGIHQNSLTNWKKQLTRKELIAPEIKNDCVQEFLNSKYNNSDNKKFNYLDVDIVSEIKWVVLNSQFPRFIIAQFYEIDDNYISQLKSGYVWGATLPQEPKENRKIQISESLQFINNIIHQEIQEKKKAAAWLILYTSLELSQISDLLNLNYLHVYRVFINKKENIQKIYDLCENISNIIYTYDFNTSEYFYNIVYKT